MIAVSIYLTNPSIEIAVLMNLTSLGQMMETIPPPPGPVNLSLDSQSRLKFMRQLIDVTLQREDTSPGSLLATKSLLLTRNRVGNEFLQQARARRLEWLHYSPSTSSFSPRCQHSDRLILLPSTNHHWSSPLLISLVAVWNEVRKMCLIDWLVMWEYTNFPNKLSEGNRLGFDANQRKKIFKSSIDWQTPCRLYNIFASNQALRWSGPIVASISFPPPLSSTSESNHRVSDCLTLTVIRPLLDGSKRDQRFYFHHRRRQNLNAVVCARWKHRRVTRQLFKFGSTKMCAFWAFVAEWPATNGVFASRSLSINTRIGSM